MARSSTWDGVDRRCGDDRRGGVDRRGESRDIWQRRSGLDRRGHKLYAPFTGEHPESETIEPEGSAIPATMHTGR